MRLKSFQIKNYKSILDSGPVEIRPDVTCLMGMNESGKSACMQALWKFHNVSGVKYDRLYDLPAETYTDFRKEDPDVVYLTFLFEEKDQKALSSAFADMSALPAEIAVSSTYDGRHSVRPVGVNYPSLRYESVAEDFVQLKASLAAIAEATGDTATKQPYVIAIKAMDALSAAGTKVQFASEIPTALRDAALASLSGVPSAASKDLRDRVIADLEQFHEASDRATKLQQWLWERMPNFIYFDEYGSLRTRINLPTFSNYLTNPPAGPDEQKQVRTQTALFEWSRLEPGEILQLGQPKAANESQESAERRKTERARLLESASFKLSGDWREWWDGSSHQLKFAADGDDLTLSVADDVNPWSIPFGERSRGFQWFFSFYLTFLVESQKAHQESILLLDEPGLHLHLARQLKLLKFFQKLSGVNQIIYSSHSPFMVDPDHIDNVRTVYLKAKESIPVAGVEQTKESKSNQPRYTKVSKDSEPEGERDTLLPLQYAGAYLLAQTLFIGKRTLIVEGISDYWMLHALSNYARENGGGHLQDGTVILWAGGTSRLVTLASVMAIREQVGPNRIAVLLDSDKAGTDQARRLVEILVHGSESLKLIGDILNVKRGTVEDVVESAELLDALANIGRQPTGTPSRRQDETNVELLRRLFRENGWGELTVEEKAKIVLTVVDVWSSKGRAPADASLARARLVFDSINKTFEVLLTRA